MPDKCRSCNAPIIWARTMNDKAMPVDAVPVMGGNIELSADGRVLVFSKKTAAEQARPLYMAHHATCPHAAEHRQAQVARDCPFAGCTKRIPSEKFACLPHWRSLSQDQQNTIWRAYRQWEAGTLAGEELRAIQQQVLDEAEGRQPQ